MQSALGSERGIRLPHQCSTNATERSCAASCGHGLVWVLIDDLVIVIECARKIQFKENLENQQWGTVVNLEIGDNWIAQIATFSFDSD